ncbi:MAG: hypothetical protein QM724_02940 [Flavobacteriales bacterium]
MKPVALSLAVLLLTACGGGAPASDDGTATDPIAVDTLPTAGIDLARYDLPLLLNAPDKQSTGGAEPSIVWKDEIGKLAVTAGDRFKLTIVEEPGDVARLKADLGRDMLKKNTVLQETPDLVIYKSEFPDDPDLVFIHFYQVVKVGDRSFAVEDAQDGTRFTEQDVQRMAAAITPRQPA